MFFIFNVIAIIIIKVILMDTVLVKIKVMVIVLIMVIIIAFITSPFSFLLNMCQVHTSPSILLLTALSSSCIHYQFFNFVFLIYSSLTGRYTEANLYKEVLIHSFVSHFLKKIVTGMNCVCFDVLI